MSDRIGSILDQALVGTNRPPLDEANRYVAFRRQFALNVVPKDAVIHLFANSRYVLWINGHYVERGPGRFEPAAPEYDTIPITPFLNKGENTVAVLVTGPVSNGKIAWRPLAFTALIEAGDQQIVTDASWKWSDQTQYLHASVNWANVYDQIDNRAPDAHWIDPAFHDHEWQPAQPISQAPGGSEAALLHPVTRVDDRMITLTVVRPWWGHLTARRAPRLKESIVSPKWEKPYQTELTAGEGVSFKFNHLVLAYTHLTVEAEPGSEIELTYTPETKLICGGGRQEFMTTDTHSIYDGEIRVKSGRVKLLNVEFVERLYPFDRVGSFNSSDPLLNKLWTTCVRGLEVTSEDAYVDCTDRERVEWMDCDPPAFDVTRVAFAGPSSDAHRGPYFADPRLLEEMIRRTGYSIQPDGWVKAHTSSDRFDIHAKMEDRGCDWIEGARRYYETSHKTEVLREVWPMMVRQMDYFLARRSPRGLVNAREWVVWGNPVGYQTCEGTALNCFVARALLDAAYLGNLIGEPADARRFEAAGNQLKEAINRELWDPTIGTYYGGYYDLAIAKKALDYRPLALKVTDHLIEPTRHAALFALDQEIVPSDRIESVTRFLKSNRPHENDIMQYYYFFRQQYAWDKPEEDQAIIDTLRREWADMAESPYEATFEGLHATGSLAHAYGIFPAYFLSSFVLGVRLDGAITAKSLMIEPRLGDLTSASGIVVTEFGPVHVEWQVKDHGGRFNLTIPKGTTARLSLPGPAKFEKFATPAASKRGRWIEYRIKSGTYSGTWQTN